MAQNKKIIALEISLYNKNLYRYWTEEEAKKINILKGLKGFKDYIKNNNNKTCKIILTNKEIKNYPIY